MDVCGSPRPSRVPVPLIHADLPAHNESKTPVNDVSPGKLTLIIGGLVAFVCSILPWIGSGIGGPTHNAWGSGMFPVATFSPIFALVAAVLVGLPAFTEVKLPAKVLDFTIDQLVLICVFFSVIITFGYAILIALTDGASIEVGLMLCLIAVIAMGAGWFMDFHGIGANPHPGVAAPPPTATGFSQSESPFPPASSHAPPTPTAPSNVPPTVATPVDPPQQTQIPGVTPEEFPQPAKQDQPEPGSF